MTGEFINPYNFVTLGDCVPEASFVDFEKFHNNAFSGQITCTVKSVGNIPIFIPDAKTQHYAVLLDTEQEVKIRKRKKEADYTDGKEYFFKMSEQDIEIKDTEPVINLEFKDTDKLYQSIKERSCFIKGVLTEMLIDSKGTKKFCIITSNPKSYASKAHKILRFCKDPYSQPMIPSTTMKGMIRNLVEMLSNSCMAFFDDKSIFYRLNPKDKNNLKEIGTTSQSTYIVTEKTDTEAKLLPLDAAKINTAFVIENEIGSGNAYAVIVYDTSAVGGTGTPTYIKRIGRKDAMEKCGEKYGTYLTGKRKNQTCKTEEIIASMLPGISSKDDFHVELSITVSGTTLSYYEPRILDKNIKDIYALVYEKTINSSFKKYYVKAVNSNQTILGAFKKSNTIYKNCEIVPAGIKRSGEIETKTQDVLFFKYRQADLQKYIAGNARNTISIDKKVVDSYEDVLKERKERLLSQDEPTKLRTGDLVYYNQGGKYLSYTQIPRKKYSHSIGDLVKRKRKSCNDLGKLCPMCNMFGSTDIRENNKSSTISGKISFGTGRMLGKEYTLDAGSDAQQGKPLKILSSPKPSCTQFYLTNGDYNSTDSKIRGRKMYYHHHKGQLKYEMVKGDYKGDIIRNNQNVSVELISNFTFTFKIDFVNLSKYELGLLLFAIDLKNENGQKMYHKIGMGKPLGLGTVEIEIDHAKSFLINRQTRYTGLFSNGQEALDNVKIKDIVNCYKEKQSQIYQGNKTSPSDFYRIPYISDLFHILEVNTTPNGYPEVKYPRKCEGGEPRGFKWFEDELRSQKLPTPEAVKNNTTSLKNWE